MAFNKRPNYSLVSKPALEPINLQYITSLSPKKRAELADQALLAMAQCLDWSLIEENFYINMGATRNKSSLSFTFNFGADSKVPSYADNLVSLLGVIHERIGELSTPVPEDVEGDEETPF